MPPVPPEWQALRRVMEFLRARWDDELEDVVPVPLDEWRARYAAR